MAGLFKKAVASVSGSMGLTDTRLIQWFAGEPTHSGETVTVDKALQLDAVYACARLVAQTIATLPIMLYERGDGAGKSRVADDHPLYRVIHDRPNYRMTAVDFWTGMVACMLLWGNAYAIITKGANGRVVALDPCMPDSMKVELQLDGSRTYSYTESGRTTVYQEEDILHLKGFSLDGMTGMSAIAFGRHSLGTAIGAERTAGSIFKNGLRPSGYLKIPNFLSPENRAKTRQYLTSFAGAENTGKIPMFEGGWEFTSLSLPPDDAQLLETRSFNVETICRWFGVPPSLIGHTQKSTTWGTGLEQINLGFLTYCLRAHLKQIEQALGHRCLSVSDQLDYYAEFNVEGLLRADSKGRAEYYRGMVGAGLMTPNEIRALENLPPKEGGDHLLVQGAMMPLDVLVEQAVQAVVQMMAMGQQQLAGPEGEEEDPLDPAVPADTTDAEIDAVTDDELKGLFAPELLEKQ